jgi:outer membrane protein assembly factor BamB
MRKKTLLSRIRIAAAVAVGAATLCLSALSAQAEDWPMFGRTPQRNMVSPDKNPPTDWDVQTGKNILWSATLGSLSYGNPVVANGIVSVGTNNEGQRDPSISADGGVEMAFDANTGKFAWQHYYPKLPSGRVNDWPQEGLCATAYAEPGKLWYCTNRCQVVCLDLSPGAQSPGKAPKPIWTVDMIGQFGVFPHNMTACSIVAWQDNIYVETGNGVDDTHKHVVAPQAPGLICFNKNTGKAVWSSNIAGANVLHGQWASVAIAEVNGRPLAIAPLGDAWVYAFDARDGKIVWKFDTNPKNAVYPQTRNEIISTPVIVGNRMYIGNGQDPEHGEGYAHFWCVDITGEGDVSPELDADPGKPAPKPGDELVGEAGSAAAGRKGKPNPNSKMIWHFDQADANHNGKIERGEHMNRTISTASVTPEGLVFISDFSGFLHCLDANNGTNYWDYDMESAMWGSPLYIDGKIFVTDEDGDVRIFPARKEEPKKEDVIEHNLGSSSYCSPVFVNGILYISSKDHLFAIKNGAQSKGLAVDAGKAE